MICSIYVLFEQALFEAESRLAPRKVAYAPKADAAVTGQFAASRAFRTT
jgi:hypothetical protein